MKLRLKFSNVSGYTQYFNPSCASPPELCDPPYPHETKVPFLKNAFPTMAEYCFAFYPVDKMIYNTMRGW